LAWQLPEWGALPDTIGIDHRSNGGACNGANRGQDALMFGWRF